MKDYFGYAGKTVVVTGASSGMGKASAEMLVDLGANVYALDWNECPVNGIAKYVHVDLSKKESIDEAMSVRGYEALAKCIEENNPDGVIDTITKSGLRGRGGGGFIFCQVRACTTTSHTPIVRDDWSKYYS